jgi:hypothetical protein
MDTSSQSHNQSLTTRNGEESPSCRDPVPSLRHAITRAEMCFSRLRTKACMSVRPCQVNVRVDDGLGKGTSYAPWCELPDVLLARIFSLLDAAGLPDWDLQRWCQVRDFGDDTSLGERRGAVGDDPKTLVRSGVEVSFHCSIVSTLRT